MTDPMTPDLKALREAAEALQRVDTRTFVTTPATILALLGRLEKAEALVGVVHDARTTGYGAMQLNNDGTIRYVDADSILASAKDIKP